MTLGRHFSTSTTSFTATAILVILVQQMSTDGADSETLSLSIGETVGGLLSSNCPEFCACKWKKGKETVTCGLEAQFKEIPKIKDPGTQVRTHLTAVSHSLLPGI